MSRITCPHCGFSNTSTATFCGNCGRDLGLPASPSGQVYCSQCETANPSTSAFCSSCGRRLPNAAAAERRGNRFFTVLVWVGGLIIVIAAGLYYVPARDDGTVGIGATTRPAVTAGSNGGEDNTGPPSATESPFAIARTTVSYVPTVTPFPTGTPRPTLTPLPIATPRPPTPRPSLTPTTRAESAPPTINASPGSLALESFDSGDANQLVAAYRINAPGNELSLSLAPSGAGGQALAMTYSINNAPPSDYAGVESDRTPMDWRNYAEVCLWVQNDGFKGHLVFQFREQAADTWKTAVRLGNITATTICLPLHTDTFRNFSGNANAGMNLEAIDNFAIYLGDGGIDQGTLLVDAIRLNP